jgi:integrase
MGRMARGALPQLRLHKRSGMARVRVGHKEFWLGRWGDPEAHRKYAEFIVAYLQRGEARPTVIKPSSTDVAQDSADRSVAELAAQPSIDQTVNPVAPQAITVAEICARYLDFAERHYAHQDGRQTTTFGNAKMGIRALAAYDHLPAEKFGPVMLTQLMYGMVGHPSRRKGKDGKPRLNTRSSINTTIKQVRRIFRWAVGMELIPANAWHALNSVELLRANRTAALEGKPRRPVADDIIERTLPHLPRVVADMVRIQRRIGCRPGELCRMVPRDIDRSDDVWVWRLQEHKTAWRGEEREIAIGPRAQVLLLPYLERSDDMPCFLPSESEAERNASRRASRRTPLTPSAKARRRKARRRCRSVKPYDEKAYCRAITRACERQGIPRWTPHQLRHAVANEIRHKEDLDAAQAVLGHKHAKVTEVYAQVRREKMSDMARKYG